MKFQLGELVPIKHNDVVYWVEKYETSNNKSHYIYYINNYKLISNFSDSNMLELILFHQKLYSNNDFIIINNEIINNNIPIIN